MKIISWNINSLRLRLPLLKKFVEENNPDVVCLQEIKVCDEDFPLLAVKALGFDFVEFSGEKSYNGVAIFSKFPLSKIEKIDVLNYGHKRHISAAIQTKIGEVILHNFYVPAGGDIPDVALNDKFDHKLKFVDWMAEFFSRMRNANESETGFPYLGGCERKENDLNGRFQREGRRVSATIGVQKRIIILGDFNIAPLPDDVWSHKQLLKIVSHTPIEVEKLTNLQRSLDFIDTHRFFIEPPQKLYSWWSYRARDPLGADKGRRLDHIWATPSLKTHLKETKIHRNFRSETQPSDHVPVETSLELF